MRTIIILFLLGSFTTYAQETKKITIETNSPYYSKEVFYVLKSDKKTKHGEYFRYGFSKSISEKGTYTMDKKTGIWEFFQFNGQLEQKYDYDQENLVYLKESLNKPRIWTEINGEFEEITPQTFPIFIGGQARTFIYLGAITYPADARRKGIQGKVLVSAVITKDGTIIDEQIFEGLGYGCDEEALRIIQSIPDEWIPATINKENVNTKIILPITFKLD